MASLSLHGDLGDGAEPLERTLQVVPILGAPQNLAAECTPLGKLPIGMVYRAVVAMVEGLNGSAAEAESIVVINHSICDTEAPFSQRASYWAKLIDHLSHKYRLLFVMSAGNNQDPFAIDAYSDADRTSTRLNSSHKC